MVEAIKLGKGMISESWENHLKNIALLLGVLSVVAIILFCFSWNWKIRLHELVTF